MITKRELLDKLRPLLLAVGGQSIDEQNSDVFYQACLFIEENLEGHFNWANLKKEESDQLQSILKQCLKLDDASKLSFDELSVRAQLTTLQQQFTNSISINLNRENTNTGIQEKYLKSQLGAREPLTSLDIKRFIVQSNMVGKIYVADLDARDLGLILNQAMTTHKADTDPYSIAMMINSGNNRWLSLTIEINPLSNEINYKANAGYQLTEKQKTTLEMKIKEAITYQSEPDLSARTYNAYPIAAQITGLIKQTPNSYQALQQLYKTIAPLGKGYETADEFAQLDNNTNTLKHYFYQSQFSAISVPPTQLTQVPNREDFVLGKLKKEVITEQLKYVIAPASVAAAQTNFVLEQVSALNFFHKKFSFPGENLRKPLSSTDYQRFITLIEEKFKKHGHNKVLDELTINCHSDAALEGLIAYNETKLPLPFKTLVLDINPINLSQAKVRTNFLFNLKTLLLTMSEHNLQELKISDDAEHLDHKTIQELVQFIKDRAIAIDINLPERYADTPFQKEVDDATSDQIRQRAIGQLAKIDEQTVVKSTLGDAVRKRPKLSGKQNIVVDVELQQEQQVETPIETEMLGKLEAPDSSDSTYTYLSEEFNRALRNGEFTLSSKSWLIVM